MTRSGGERAVGRLYAVRTQERNPLVSIDGRREAGLAEEIPKWMTDPITVCGCPSTVKGQLVLWNALALVGHLAGVLVTVIFGVKDNDFSKPTLALYRPTITWNETSDTDGGSRFDFTPGTELLDWELSLPLLTLIFFLLSAAAHAMALVPYLVFNRVFYFEWISECKNPMRWVEYAFSASIMVLTIAYTSGIKTLYLLICIFMLSFVTMTFGWTTECLSRPAPGGFDLAYQSKKWATESPWQRLTPHALGYIPYLTMWAILMDSFYYNTRNVRDQMPPFVFAIVWSQAVLFTMFGVVQLVQQASNWGCENYWRGEVAYCVLSLTAKLLLGSILIANVFMFTKFDEAFDQT